MMTVKRIVAKTATYQSEAAKAFYGEILEMKIAVDRGCIVTYASEAVQRAQLSFASDGGSGTAVPDLSIEVDYLDEVHARLLTAGVEIEYGPASELWGVRRFYVRDPLGRLVSILSHNQSTQASAASGWPGHPMIDASACIRQLQEVRHVPPRSL